MRVSVDVGGTFTDVIVLDEGTGQIELDKVATTPANPAQGVLDGFQKVGAQTEAIEYFVHGTTLGINAMLTRSGAKVAFITTKGFRDIYILGRTDREPMYDFKYKKPESLVPRYLCYEVEERLNYKGHVLSPFNRDQAAKWRAPSRRKVWNPWRSASCIATSTRTTNWRWPKSLPRSPRNYP